MSWSNILFGILGIAGMSAIVGIGIALFSNMGLTTKIRQWVSILTTAKEDVEKADETAAKKGEEAQKEYEKGEKPYDRFNDAFGGNDTPGTKHPHGN